MFKYLKFLSITLFRDVCNIHHIITCTHSQIASPDPSFLKCHNSSDMSTPSKLFHMSIWSIVILNSTNWSYESDYSSDSQANLKLSVALTRYVGCDLSPQKIMFHFYQDMNIANIIVNSSTIDWFKLVNLSNTSKCDNLRHVDINSTLNKSYYFLFKNSYFQWQDSRSIVFRKCSPTVFNHICSSFVVAVSYKLWKENYVHC